MSEVRRAVERIDDPTAGSAQGGADASLFTEEIMLRTQGAKSIRDEILRGPVGLGNQVDRALELHVVRLTEAVAQYYARVAGDLCRLARIVIQDRVRHGVPSLSWSV
jgi:hypothetical protein